MLQVTEVPLPSLSGMALRNPQTSQEKGPSLSLQPPEKRNMQRFQKVINSLNSINNI